MGITEDMLNPEQKEALDKAVDWGERKYKPTFEIAGVAGSGKTSLVELMMEKLGVKHENILFMSLVGTAATMLSLRGCMATTIHSAIYKLVPLVKTDKEGNPIMRNDRVVTYMGFQKRESLPSHVEYLVVDEAGMPSEEQVEDILSFGIPVIALGDLEQLPPVFGRPGFLRKPDARLTKPMRQKENDPIIILSQMALNREFIRIRDYGPKCHVIDKKNLSLDMIQKSDVVICTKNKTRQHFNDLYRRDILKVADPNRIYEGEKIICRKNNWKLRIDDKISLTNGLRGTVDNINWSKYDVNSLLIDFIPVFETNEYFRNLRIDYRYLHFPIDSTYDGDRFKPLEWFQFSYALTSYLVQGSQFPSVVVYDEEVGSEDFYFKSLYTGITRAESELIIAKDNYTLPSRRNSRPRGNWHGLY